MREDKKGEKMVLRFRVQGLWFRKKKKRGAPTPGGFPETRSEARQALRQPAAPSKRRSPSACRKRAGRSAVSLTSGLCFFASLFVFVVASLCCCCCCLFDSFCFFRRNGRGCISFLFILPFCSLRRGRGVSPFLFLVFLSLGEGQRLLFVSDV